MATATTLPKDVSKLGQEIKLFGKWDTQECVEFDLPEHLPCIDMIPVQRRSEGYFLDGLHPSPPRCLLASHCWPLCQEAVQEGTNAYRRAVGRQVRTKSFHTRVKMLSLTAV